MKKKSEIKRVVFSKRVGWIILIFLVVLDASLDVIFAHGSGLESAIWKPISDFLGVSNPLFLTPLVLILFYFVVKGGSWLMKKEDKIQANAEELVLTTLVIIYSVFDLWLISVYLFDFNLFPNHFYLIPILIIIGIIYNWWAEKKLKN